MKLKAWAQRQGIGYKTAWRWFHEGTLPVPAEQTRSGTILVTEGQASPPQRVALYARVSGSDQKADLERQVGRLTTYATDNGWSVQQTVAEVGSGLNGKRPKLLKILANHSITTIIVEHRDRLARFGADYIEACLHASGRELVVVDSSEMHDDLVQDMVDVMTSFCARLYGRRSARNRAQQAIKAVAKD